MNVITHNPGETKSLRSKVLQLEAKVEDLTAINIQHAEQYIRLLRQLEQLHRRYEDVIVLLGKKGEEL